MKKPIMLILLLLQALPLLSQSRVITVKECIDIALQNHPDYFASIEEQKKSIFELKGVRSQKSIIINGEIRTIETEKETETTTSGIKIPGKDTDIGLFAGLTLYYPVYDARKDYEEEISKLHIDMTKLKSQSTRLDIIFEVKNAYYGYLMAKSILVIREDIYRRNLKKVELARQLFEGGSRPILDLSKAEVDLADAQLQYEMAKNTERKMKMNLFHAMGLEESDEVEIEPVEIKSMPVVSVSLDELYRISYIYSPSIRSISLEKRLALLKISYESAAHYPRVNIQVGLGYELDKIRGAANPEDNVNSRNWSPVFYGLFQMTIPVYSGGGITSKVESAESEYNRIEFKDREIIIQTKNQIRDCYRSLEDINRQLEISALIMKNAERHLLLAQKNYDNGGGSLLELQDAEVAVIKARMVYQEARYNYLIILARLSQLIGTGEEYICGDSAKKISQ